MSHATPDNAEAVRLMAEGCAVGRDRLGLGRDLFGTPLVDDTQPQTEVLRFAVDLAPDEMLGFSTVLRELEPKLGMKVVLEYVSTDTQYLQLKKGKGPCDLVAFDFELLRRFMSLDRSDGTPRIPLNLLLDPKVMAYSDLAAFADKQIKDLCSRTRG